MLHFLEWSLHANDSSRSSCSRRNRGGSICHRKRGDSNRMSHRHSVSLRMESAVTRSSRVHPFALHHSRIVSGNELEFAFVINLREKSQTQTVFAGKLPLPFACPLFCCFPPFRPASFRFPSLDFSSVPSPPSLTFLSCGVISYFIPPSHQQLVRRPSGV